MDSLRAFVQDLANTYKNGIDMQHFARRAGHNIEMSTMPSTSFIYDFMLYNKLYSVNWDKSCEKGRPVTYAEDSEKRHLHEWEKQIKFEKSLKKLAIQKPEILLECFAPLAVVSLEGEWTGISPDDYIIEPKDGREFFKRLQRLQELVENAEDLDRKKLDLIFERIKECRQFVNRARNSVFHGSTVLGVMADKGQIERIKVYDMFLRCLLSSFFSLARDLIP